MSNNDNQWGAHSDDDDEDDEDEVSNKITETPKTGNNNWDEEAIGVSDTTEDFSLRINPRVVAQLDDTLQEILTEMAIKTVAYYMEEFRDDVSKQWMTTFDNYSSNGFSSKGWRAYLENMIKLDKHEILVVMTPPKQLLAAHRLPANANVKIQYNANIDPRKIANQILTVRENLCKEVIDDLGSIRNENNEAARIARIWSREGKESANKARRQTRMSDQSESTPLRDSNFEQLNMMLTNLAIDLLRSDELHTHSRDEHIGMISHLDHLLSDLAAEDEKREPHERLLFRRGPQTMLERLYLEGFQVGFVKEGNIKINALKLAQELLKLRQAVSMESVRLLSNSIVTSRSYYKMIKDYGGFQKLDLSSRPKWKLIDLDEELKKEQEARLASASAIAANLLKPVAPPKDLLSVKESTSVSDSVSPGVSGIRAKTASDQDDYFDFDDYSSGPMLM